MKIQPMHWICTTSKKSPFGKSGTTGGVEITPDTLLSRIENLQGQVDFCRVMDNPKNINWGDAVWIYAGDGVMNVYGLAWAVEADDLPRSKSPKISLSWDVSACRKLSASPIRWDEQWQKAPRRPPAPVSATAKQIFQSWLDSNGTGFSPLYLDDLDDDYDEREYADARRLRRIGQGKFRTTLLDHYKVCAVTGESVPAALDAAHVDPYRGVRSNTPKNGLLLRLDLHRLFDRYLISFDAEGLMLCSPALAKSSYGSKSKYAQLSSVARKTVTSTRLANHLERAKRRWAQT